MCQHLTSPASDALFSNAIIQSGDCDGPWLLVAGKNAKRFGNVYAAEVGCPATGDSAGRVACLRALTVSQILDPYIRWLCPVPEPNNVWCNRTHLNATLPQPASSSARSARVVGENTPDEARLVLAAAAAAAAAAAGGKEHVWVSPGSHPRTASLERLETDNVSNFTTSSGPPRLGAEKEWPTPRPPMAPLGGFIAVVDGTAGGLPDTPLRMMEKGLPLVYLVSFLSRALFRSQNGGIDRTACVHLEGGMRAVCTLQH